MATTRNEIQKIQNPQYGAFTASYRAIKGHFSGSLSKAKSFQYLLKNNTLSRQFDFPKEFKHVQDKKDYIYLILAKVLTANQKRQHTQAVKKGKTVTFAPIEETLDIDESTLERLREKYPDTFARGKGEERIERLTNEDFSMRHLRARANINARNGYIFDYEFYANTFGRQNSYTKDGSPTQNWVENQIKSGLLSRKEKPRKNKRFKKTYEYTDNGSIIYQVNRFIREVLTKNKEKFVKLSRMKKYRKTVFSVAIITDVKKHPDFLVSDVGHEIDFFRTGEGFKTQVDKATWNMAKDVLRLINTDYEGDDEISGRLTSGEIYTKIRLDPSLYADVSYTLSLRVRGKNAIR